MSRNVTPGDAALQEAHGLLVRARETLKRAADGLGTFEQRNAAHVAYADVGTALCGVTTAMALLARDAEGSAS